MIGFWWSSLMDSLQVMLWKHSMIIENRSGLTNPFKRILRRTDQSAEWIFDQETPISSPKIFYAHAWYSSVLKYFFILSDSRLAVSCITSCAVWTRVLFDRMVEIDGCLTIRWRYEIQSISDIWVLFMILTEKTKVTFLPLNEHMLTHLAIFCV